MEGNISEEVIEVNLKWEESQVSLGSAISGVTSRTPCSER